VEDAADGDDLQVLDGDNAHLLGNKMVNQLHIPEQQAADRSLPFVFVLIVVVVVVVVAFELRLFLLAHLAKEIQIWKSILNRPYQNNAKVHQQDFCCRVN